MIWNSDQGSHFTSPQYLARGEGRGIQVSMDGKGRALDNIFTERLWRTVKEPLKINFPFWSPRSSVRGSTAAGSYFLTSPKYEEVYPRSYGTPREARHSLARYVEFYNHERPHQALAYRTSAEVDVGTRSAATAGDNLTHGEELGVYDLAPIAVS